MTLEIRLLGAVSITGPGGRHRADDSLNVQASLAFAMLTLERERGVGRETLADAIWPGGLPPTWASALRSLISRVRTFVGTATGEPAGEVLVAAGGRYQLRVPATTRVDVEQADHQLRGAEEATAAGELDVAERLLVEAVDRLRHPLLPSCAGEWVDTQNARRSFKLVSGLELLSRVAGRRSNDVAALAAAEEAVRRAPLRESAHRCLMAAHAGAGNRAEALRSYFRLRRLLADELGVDPDAETESAYIELLGPTPTRFTVGTDDAPRPEVTGAAEVPFVGRQIELESARHVWRSALDGAPRVLLVTGEPGIGKTRFASELAREVAAGGALVLFGRCDPGGTSPFQPFIEILDALEVGPPPLRSPSSDHDVAAVVHAVGDVLDRTAADRPVLVVLDDLQWADPTTLTVLRELLRRRSRFDGLVLAAARTPLPADGHLAQTIQLLQRDVAVSRVSLSGLDQAACRSIVRHLTPAGQTSEHAHRLAADTAGNPFLLLDQATRTAGGPYPPTDRPSPGVEELLTGWLHGLSADGRRLLATAAVSGRRLVHDVVAEASGLGEQAAFTALDGVLATGLVIEADDDPAVSYRFVHEAVRRAVYAGLSRTQRRFLHGRVADAVERSRPTGCRARDLALHRSEGAEPGGDLRAVRAALGAAEEARADGSLAGAVVWCRRALDHVSNDDEALRAEVLTELGRTLAEAGDEAASDTLFQGASAGLRSRHLDTAARAALFLADLARGDDALVEDAAVLVHEVLTADLRPGGLDDEHLNRFPWARLVASQIEMGRTAAANRATQLATAGTTLAQHLRSGAVVPDVGERLRLARELRVIAEAQGSDTTLVLACHHQAMAAATLGATEELAEALDTLGRAMLASGHPATPLLVERELAEAVADGRFDVVDERTTVDWTSDLAQPPPGFLLVHQRFVASWLRGRLDETPTAAASEALEQVVAAERALVALAAGDRCKARILARDLLRQVPATPSDDCWLHAHGVLSLAATELDDRSIAADLYDRLAPHALLTCGVGYRTFVGTVDLHLGQLAAAIGAWGDAERHLQSAMARLTAIGARPWVALARRRLAEVLHARRRPGDDWCAALLAGEATSLGTASGLAPFPLPAGEALVVDVRQTQAAPDVADVAGTAESADGPAWPRTVERRLTTRDRVASGRAF